ncbi:MAG: D-tyrosyl-tRNA(Tyr) deacylase [Bacteroidetes bacterium]|nr:D-tyrosyl-tRNA(Tyr) deacylase [Bacteroidota bacterium]
MRVVIQRVKCATVEIRNKIHSSVGQGLLVFLGIENDDGEEDINWLCKKIIQLRIFDDKDGVMNLSVADVNDEILVISQFTLHAKTKKGNRPSYIKAARPDVAIPLYEKFVEKLGFYLEKKIKTGEFGALMQVSLVNNGPVTIIIDSKNKDI